MPMRNQAKKRLVVYMSAGLLMIGCRTLRTSGDTTISVCELARRGPEMAGRRVRVKAVYESDRRESSLLVDGTCPSVALSPLMSRKKGRDPSIDGMEEAMYQVPSDYRTDPLRVGMGVTLAVDVSGTFAWKSDEHPPGQLTIDRVWHWERVAGAAKR